MAKFSMPSRLSLSTDMASRLGRSTMPSSASCSCERPGSSMGCGSFSSGMGTSLASALFDCGCLVGYSGGRGLEVLKDRRVLVGDGYRRRIHRADVRGNGRVDGGCDVEICCRR